LQPAIKNLSVSAILLAILGGIIGIVAGLFLGFALGSALAAAFHVSTFEGEAGYFAVAIALLVTFIVMPALIHCESRRAAYSPLWRNRLSDSLQAGLPGSIKRYRWNALSLTR
jgi:hypothetical protein